MKTYWRLAAAGALAATVAGAGPGAAASPGLVAAYALDEDAGTAVADASGNGNTGTISGATWTTAGRYGSALSFDGTNDGVTVADAASLDLTAALTLEAWVKPSSLSRWRTAVMKEQPGGLVYGIEANTDSNQPSAHVFTTTELYTSGGSQLPIGSWSHVAATYDGSALRLYVNGAQVALRAVSGSLPNSSGALRIGGNSVWGEYFHGVIDEVRVYNRALFAGEIQTDMNSAVGGPPPADTTAPTTPADFRVTGTSQTSISSAWSASSDDVGVSGYRVDRGATSVATTSDTSFTFTGLTCGTTYSLGVEAFDGAGNVSGRATLAAATGACTAPGADLYLSPAGSDANPCTQSAPCHGLQRAYDLALPGTVVELAGGNYPAQTIAGTKPAPAVIFRPAPGASVRIGSTLTISADQIEFRDLTLAGWHSKTESSNVTFRNVIHWLARSIEGSYAMQFLGDLNPSGCTGNVIRYNTALQELHSADCGISYIGNLGDKYGFGCHGTYRYNLWFKESAVATRCSTTDIGIQGDPGFVGQAAFDLHLRLDSRAVNAGDPTNYPSRDHDGETRPIGAAPDIGADEAG